MGAGDVAERRDRKILVETVSARQRRFQPKMVDDRLESLDHCAAAATGEVDERQLKLATPLEIEVTSRDPQRTRRLRRGFGLFWLAGQPEAVALQGIALAELHVVVVPRREVGGTVQMRQQIADMAETEERPADTDMQIELLLLPLRIVGELLGRSQPLPKEAGGFRIGIPIQRPRARHARIADRLLPSFGAMSVVGQEVRLLTVAMLLQRGQHGRMHSNPAAQQDAVIGGLADESVAEPVALDTIRRAEQRCGADLDEEAARAEPGEHLVERIGWKIGDPAQQVASHRRSHHGGGLQNVFLKIEQPVDARVEQRAQRGGHAQELDRAL